MTRGLSYVSMAVAALACLVALVAGSSAPRAESPFGRAVVEIDTATGLHRFNVEVASTPSQHAAGLMYRAELAPDAGMLFLFERERVVGMWMKNTLIPLDMVFIAGDGRVVSIAENTMPLSERVITSGAPVRAVLEVKGDTVRRLGLRPGDRVRYELLPNPS